MISTEGVWRLECLEPLIHEDNDESNKNAELNEELS